LKQQILPPHFLNIKVIFTDKFKGEITYAIFGRFKFKRELLGRNRAGGKAIFLLFLISLQHVLARYKECLGQFGSCFEVLSSFGS
jgi:hypothetical protein